MSYFVVKNLTVKRGSFKLENISLSLDKGDFAAIIGKTGSGKTSLIETITGINKPIGGTIELDKEDITKKPIEQRKISIVYQDFMLFRHMNVEKNLKFPKNFDSLLFDEVVNTFGLEKILKLYPEELSGGEKQKVAIARALLNRPKLLILDEPLSSIDFSFRRLFLNFIKEIHERFNLTTIYVTHNLKEALKLSNKCGILINGKLEQFDLTENLFKKPKTKEIAEFLGFKNILPGKLIKSSKNFFTISPYNIEIGSNGQLTFVANLTKVLKRDFGYEILAEIENHKISLICKDIPPETFHISFNKKDIWEFN